MLVYEVRYEQGSNYFGASQETIYCRLFKQSDCAIAFAYKVAQYFFDETKKEENPIYSLEYSDTGYYTWGIDCDTGPQFCVEVIEYPVYIGSDPDDDFSVA